MKQFLFKKFQQPVLSTIQKQQVKGGDDFIIIDDLIGNFIVIDDLSGF